MPTSASFWNTMPIMGKPHEANAAHEEALKAGFGGAPTNPGGLPPIHTKPKASDKEIEQDFDQFEYQALVVEPHTTRAGFLWYDVSDLDHPLRGARMHLHKLRNADGQELFYFEIPFDNYLKSKSTQMN